MPILPTSDRRPVHWVMIMRYPSREHTYLFPSSRGVYQYTKGIGIQPVIMNMTVETNSLNSVIIPGQALLSKSPIKNRST